ncbi:NYN domain-containing protein [Hoyosella rhizosphaerae]|uniref:NYN domain-containing protein n=1 Tax=Hoyosella rhizosphaerae TaxID=1755582 RepID=A0A916U5X8_9ACTN|nr:NYN domain-containing protein [Hoyosella rhizosphaerae]MBN4926306.1 NYN domain-containing protein [Hoyosella rhizosphaerae]GGC60380.1 NYN domain-containing protein [Hoyosella rhizosphaerae]
MPQPRLANAIMYIDAGYLWLTLQEMTGKTHRQQLGIDQVALLRLIGELALRHHPEVRVLRQMWYDAEPENGSPVMHHQLIRDTPGACLRTGTLRFSDGVARQKGVDTRLVADVVAASVRGITSEVIILAGDGDLVPALEIAADEGIRTCVWYIAGGDTVSRRLKGAADHVLELDPQVFLDLQYRGRPAEGSSVDFSQPAETSQELQAKAPHHDAPAAAEPAPSSTAEVTHLIEPTPPAVPDTGAPETVSADSPIGEAQPTGDATPEEDQAAETASAPPSAPPHPVPSPRVMPRFIPRRKAVRESDLIPLSVLSPHGAQLVVDTQGEPRRIGERYAQRWWESSSKEQRSRISDYFASSQQLPQRVDSDMLHLACAALSIELVPDEDRTLLREGFLSELRMRIRQP